MAVPKDTYVLSQIWGSEKVPGSEFIANLGLVKRVIKQRKSVTLTRERVAIYLHTRALGYSLPKNRKRDCRRRGERDLFREDKFAAS